MDIEIAKAINAVRCAVGAARKDSKNPHFKSSYASLKAVMAALDPILEDQVVEVVQEVNSDEDNWKLDTYISKGDKIHRSQYPLSVKDKNDPQKVLAAVTYARRGSLTTIFGMLTEDDDGNQAAQPAPKPAPVDTKKAKQDAIDKNYITKAEKAVIRICELDSVDALKKAQVLFKDDLNAMSGYENDTPVKNAYYEFQDAYGKRLRELKAAE